MNRKYARLPSLHFISSNSPRDCARDKDCGICIPRPDFPHCLTHRVFWRRHAQRGSPPAPLPSPKGGNIHTARRRAAAQLRAGQGSCGLRSLEVESCLGLEYGQQTAQLSIGFVFRKFFGGEQAFVCFVSEFLSPFWCWPLQLQCQNRARSPRLRCSQGAPLIQKPFFGLEPTLEIPPFPRRDYDSDFRHIKGRHLRWV